MLKLINIRKTYLTDADTVPALQGVDIEFRKNEFVAILGQSGCGKTTLLNIIGGLDHYNEGDLIVNGKSTKEFNDHDWDTYRNHSIGFVFQSYNLIPHQTVLSNVELAMTLSGVSKSERRKKAAAALEKVGLGDQLKKKPNQMSGGQMQRVAIARALVNDPDILLADEPTGALDSATSVQVMDILKEVAKERLVIMVTHNPDLAEQYATRTVRLLDGKVISDSDPYHGEEVAILSKKEQPKEKQTSMSFFTALSLSLQNLMTKKTRTFLTAFAGSIGIIGIALILSLSTGIKAYIDRVQQDTLSSYPIRLEKETYDLSSLIVSMTGASAKEEDEEEEEEPAKRPERKEDRVYVNSMMYRLINQINSIQANQNNLGAFKKHLADTPAFKDYLSAVRYQYNLNMPVYTKNPEGQVIRSDISDFFRKMTESTAGGSQFASLGTGTMSSSSVWEELLSSPEGGIHPLLMDQYDLVYGEWPENANELVLVVNSRNELSDLVLYILGLKTDKQLTDIMEAAMRQEMIAVDNESWTFEEICGRELRLVPSPAHYQKNLDGTYTDISTTDAGLSLLFGGSDAIELKIVGIIRPNPDAVSNMISGSICYTAELTDLVIERTVNNELLKAQYADKENDLISGLPFPTGKEVTDEEKAEAVRKHLSGLSAEEKALLYTLLMSIPSEEYLNAAVTAFLANTERAQIEQMIIAAYQQETGLTDVSTIQAYLSGLDDASLFEAASEMVRQSVTEQYRMKVETELSALTVEQKAAALDATELTAEQIEKIYTDYVPKEESTSTYEKNLARLGYLDPEQPTAIMLYADTFENKNEIADLITAYNKSVSEEDKITYTDYVALFMSSITKIINAITYVLIAFVAISLVVSSIMIGIITYISVLERTKEIGILRAIGASKKDISRVFNAETLTIGFLAGAIGIGVTLLLTIPINIIVHELTDIQILNAVLPWQGAIGLVLLSMVLTLIAGLLPSAIAANKDPVVALRTE
ncbi:MAG: ABC transporter ATP-binding protein/permease [Lachnospiraceae bacterium]|nr:ABC transporter ATP-binding protein/permease [Lachnospiraceae bacterium]